MYEVGIGEWYCVVTSVSCRVTETKTKTQTQTQTHSFETKQTEMRWFALVNKYVTILPRTRPFDERLDVRYIRFVDGNSNAFGRIIR